MATYSLSRKRQIEYSARRPTKTDLYRLVFNYRDTFERSWETFFQHDYGALRHEVLDALDKYLNCGILAHGVARAVCPKCNNSILVAFSCKRRCLCPSCDAKRSLVFTENLVSNILLPYPQRHLVFSIPKRLRCYFRFNRKLMSHLYAAAWNAWDDYVQEETSASDDAHTGMVSALHTAGDLLAWHPHSHNIALSGAVDACGNFHELPLTLNTDRVCELFRNNVFSALVKENLLDEETVDSMKTWVHSGFSVFASEPIAFNDKDRLLFLARYLKRCPVSNERMEIDESDECNPIVKYSSYRDNKVSTRTFTPLKFLAEISQHLPLIWEQTTRFFGLYSARTRGAAAKTKLSASNNEFSPIENEPARKPSISWAKAMKQVFNVDPLTCPRCGEIMKIKSFIHDSKEIKRICQNLGIVPWRAPPAMAIISLAA
ncbi:MAG: transposase [SAR324 cluster bacterium]|uniref:Transposase n=1 Tax=SAR324 cluster bacterium TaxID=2024889 RepID=A0A7X9FU17_9DELT|nr:transposase [SAR324 cluster bacterium]